MQCFIMYVPVIDFYYSSILLPGISSQNALNDEVQEIANGLYLKHQSDLPVLFSGNPPTQKQWIRLIQRMIINPSLEDDGAVVSVCTGTTTKRHYIKIAEWVAMCLMGRAPVGLKVQWMCVDDASGSAPSSYGWVTLSAGGESLVPALM